MTDTMASWHHVSSPSTTSFRWANGIHLPGLKSPPPPQVPPSHSYSYPLLPLRCSGILVSWSQEVGAQVGYDGKSETMITEHWGWPRAPVSGQVPQASGKTLGREKKEQEFTYKPTKPFCRKGLCLALSWRKVAMFPTPGRRDGTDLNLTEWG